MATAIRDLLDGILPATLREPLDAGVGWQVESAGQALLWVEVGATTRVGKQVRWSAAHSSGLRADIVFERDPDYSAATLQVTLANPTSQQSIPLSDIKPVSLRWQGLRRESVQVRSVGGGLTHAYFPPGAYRENAVALRPGGSDFFTVESGVDGRSSSRDLPFLQMATVGEASAGLVVALEWSARWFQRIGSGWQPAAPLIWEAGIPIKGLTLAPGETLALPVAHLIAYEGDLNAGGNACRRYVYDRICPNLAGVRPVPPISYDHWFGIGCDFDEDLLRRLVDRSAEMGLEYFVLDAGWYAGCGPGGEFSRGVGNWERLDAAKFPNGLEPLAGYTRSKGLKFGLWFEVERAHRSSDMVRDHPDWLFDDGGEYLHLNLAIREAQDYVIRVVGTWIDRLGLEWSRWDYNIGPTRFWEKADPTGKIQFSYVAGLYRVLDALTRDHPGWLVECCASGGRRIDLGTLRRAHTIWFSDHTEDASVCRFMQLGANRFLPGHLPNSALPVQSGEGDGTTTEADVVARMCGALSFDGHVESWSPALVARIGKLVDVYREFRHLLVGDFYPLTPQPARPSEAEVAQFISRDGSDAIVLGFAGLITCGDVQVRLRGLDPRAAYLIWDPIDGGEVRVGGKKLLEAGLRLPLAAGAVIRRLRCIGNHQLMKRLVLRESRGGVCAPSPAATSPRPRAGSSP